MLLPGSGWSRHQRLRDKSIAGPVLRGLCLTEEIDKARNNVRTLGCDGTLCRVQEDLYLNRKLKEGITCVGIFGYPKIDG